MTAFIEFLIITEVKSFQLICQYLSAVRWNLIQCGVNVEFLQDPLIKSNRAALMKLHSHVKSYKLEDSRFPATPLFVKELAIHLLSWGTLEGAALSLGAMLAFVCLLRRSEYLYKCPSETSGSYDEEVEGEDYHTIRAQDVLFEFLELNDNGIRTSVFVHPSNAHLHSSDDLVALDFVIPSSKTDQAGVGMPFHVSRMRVSKTVVFDVVFIAYQWSGHIHSLFYNEPLIIFYFMSIYIYMFRLFCYYPKCLCIECFITYQVNPHKDTRIEGETRKYRDFIPCKSSNRERESAQYCITDT